MLQRSRIWKKAAASQYARNGARVVRREGVGMSSRMGGSGREGVALR